MVWVGVRNGSRPSWTTRQNGYLLAPSPSLREIRDGDFRAYFRSFFIRENAFRQSCLHTLFLCLRFISYDVTEKCSLELRGLSPPSNTRCCYYNTQHNRRNISVRHLTTDRGLNIHLSEEVLRRDVVKPCAVSLCSDRSVASTIGAPAAVWLNCHIAKESSPPNKDARTHVETIALKYLSTNVMVNMPASNVCWLSSGRT